jgi:short-subunit dehydrogenase
MRANPGTVGAMDLTGTTALVTGASRGIGRATALALARRGVSVLATALEHDELADLARECGAAVLPADLSREGDVLRLLDWTLDGERRIDLLVNNAGFGWYGSLGDLGAADVSDIMKVNLTAPIRLTGALAPAMVARGRGHIVNVASIAGYLGVSYEGVYAATKAGLIAFSDSVRYELAGTGVGVTVVLPAAVDTGFFTREGHAYRRRVPRLADPGRVAEALVAAVEHDLPEIFVPRWMVVPVRLRGGFPRLYRRLAQRAM